MTTMRTPNRDRHDQVFYRCFVNASEGHAVWEGEPASELKPGVVGYFNAEGDWRKIVYALDKNDVEAFSKRFDQNETPIRTLTVLEEVDLLKPLVNTNWPGFMIGGKMKKLDMDLGVKAGDGSTANVAVTVGYMNSGDEGAVMTAEGDVTRNMVKQTEKLYEWLESHVDNISNHPDCRRGVRERGVWIITKTYTAKRRARAIATTKEAKVTWSVKAELAQAGNLGPSADWWESQKDSCWKADSFDGGVVLFINGYKWEPSTRPWRKTRMEYVKKENPKTLGPGDLEAVESLVEDHDSQKLRVLTLTPEVVGRP